MGGPILKWRTALGVSNLHTRGEAFCSPVCRNHAVIIELWAEEGRKVKVDHSSQGPPEPADSDEKNLFTLGIPIIT
uniref:Uncharacterized protein n=1 Tax=Vitis vinifera TaxID=29760 RepID=F6HX16_VITVI